jgi:hypothetical protein
MTKAKLELELEIILLNRLSRKIISIKPNKNLRLHKQLSLLGSLVPRHVSRRRRKPWEEPKLTF